MNTTGKCKVISPQDPIFFQLVDLDQRGFPRPWTKEDWDQLNWDQHLLLGLWQGEMLGGFALFGQLPGDDTAHLLKIYLVDTLRGIGVASTFWISCLEHLKRLGTKFIYLEVESQNLPAIAFYRKQGFLQLRKIKAYYSDGADALTMQLTL